MQSVGSRLAAIWRRWSLEHPVARAMALNWAFGAGVGVLCAALALVFNLFGLRALLWRSDIDSAMLCAAFIVTCGGLASAAAITWIDENSDHSRGRRRRQGAAEPLAARAPRRG